MIKLIVKLKEGTDIKIEKLVEGSNKKCESMGMGLLHTIVDSRTFAVTVTEPMIEMMLQQYEILLKESPNGQYVEDTRIEKS